MLAFQVPAEVQSLGDDLQTVAGYVVAVGAIFGAAWKAGVGRAVKRRRDRIRAEFLADVAGVVAPMIDGSRAAAKAQHDEQNNAIEQGFMSVHKRIDDLDDRLDKGADRLAAHDVRLAVIEARSPNTRSRQGDHQ